jgi:hypothetical protein
MEVIIFGMLEKHMHNYESISFLLVFSRWSNYPAYIKFQNFVQFQVNNCNITGTLDVSGLTGLGGIFQVYENPNINRILNPSSNQTFTTYSAYSYNKLIPKIKFRIYKIKK